MELDPSYKEILGVRKFTSVGNLKPGSIVQFTYDNEQKYALVLNPQFDNKMHALSLNAVSSTSITQLLEEVSKITNPDALYQTYKNSTYTVGRPYRTYTISKIKSLREIYLRSREVTDIIDELQLYKNIRSYSRDELIDAAGEYFENEYTFSRFPNLAKTQDDFIKMLNTSSTIVLTKSQLLNLDNSDVGDVLKSKTPMKKVKQMMADQGRGKDLQRILDGIETKVNLPLPIVIRSDNTYYLLGGNSRLCTLAALSYTMPVKLLIYRNVKS